LNGQKGTSAFEGVPFFENGRCSMIYSNYKDTPGLDLPYTLIHIYSALGDPVMYSDFKLRLCAILSSSEDRGLDVRFDILLSSPNVNAAVESGVSAAEVYAFYKKLQTVLTNRAGHAELKEEGRRTKTDLFVSYEKNGKCSLSGFVHDPDERVHPSAYRGVNFHLVFQPEKIAPSLAEFRHVFDELEKLTGYKGLYADPEVED
jgi:hypothetical protein